jgi:hypothetical protein
LTRAILLLVDPHRLAEARSLAMHREIAERLRQDPSRVDAARARVAMWRDRGEPHVHYVEAWDELLALPMDQLCTELCADDERARAMRQVSPFAGVLGPRERWRIHRETAAKQTT